MAMHMNVCRNYMSVLFPGYMASTPQLPEPSRGPCMIMLVVNVRGHGEHRARTIQAAYELRGKFDSAVTQAGHEYNKSESSFPKQALAE